MNFFILAVRNLKRRRGRTFLTIFGVAISIAVLFTLLTLNAGYEREVGKEMNTLGYHLLAVPKGCPYEAASLIIHGGVIPKYLSNDDLIFAERIDGVNLATPMLLHQFVENGMPYIVYGIVSKDMVSLKQTWKIEGRFFTDNETNVIVVGRRLAEEKQLSVGSVLLFGLTKEPFTVIGILDSPTTQDEEFYFLSLAEAQRVFNKEGKITAIAIKVQDIGTISEVSDRLEQIPDIQVVTMAQVMGTILNLVGSARTLLVSIIAIAIVISGAGIMNTLLMSINERTTEFGMMKAIGASGADIGILVLTETMIITSSGGLIGIIASIAGSRVIETFIRGIIPYAPTGSFIIPDPVLIVTCITFSVILGFICGLFPALKSSHLSPMNAMRSGWE